MSTLTILQTTIFKRSPLQSAQLPDADKATVMAGVNFELSAYKLEQGHLKITLKNPKDWIGGRNTWYVFATHVKVVEPQGATLAVSAKQRASGVKLAVPFFSQVDNKFEPMRTCNTSSCAMAAKFLGAKISGDDEYYRHVIKYGDTTDHNAQTSALEDVGIISIWHTDLGFDDLDKSLELGLPVVIGILHRGSLENPTGGHMVVVIGKNSIGGNYVVNDPYGSLLDPKGAYTGDVSNGNGAVYPRQVLARRWLVDGAATGWGRLFVKPVKG